jgi:hypothetical protein
VNSVIFIAVTVIFIFCTAPANARCVPEEDKFIPNNEL